MDHDTCKDTCAMYTESAAGEPTCAQTYQILDSLIGHKGCCQVQHQLHISHEQLHVGAVAQAAPLTQKSP